MSFYCPTCRGTGWYENNAASHHCPCDKGTIIAKPIPSIDSVNWDDTSDDREHEPKTNLLATIQILGVNMHLEAIRLANDDNMQHTYDVEDQETMDKILDGAGAGDPVEVTVVDGLPYLIFATPYCT